MFDPGTGGTEAPVLSARPYQAKAFAMIFREFDKGVERTLCVSATGTGKTIIFALAARHVIETGGRVLILAHTTELIGQAAGKLHMAGLDPAIEQAQSSALGGTLFGDEPACVVGSVQTMQRRRLERWPRGHFRLVIIDEGHHYTLDSQYQKTLDWLAPAWVLGVTATPVRADKVPLVGPEQPYETICFEYSLEEAVNDGYLKPPFYELVPTDVDLTRLRISGDDFNAEDLSAVLTPLMDTLCNDSKPYIGDRRFICFTPTIACASAAATAYTSIGLSCEYTYGDDPLRDEKLAAFSQGRFQGMANAGVLTEGYDAPWVSSVVSMVPTKSWPRAMQQIGRGTRLWPGDVDCQFIGFNWKTLKHKLIHPVEIVSGKPRDKAVIGIAEELVETGEEMDLVRALQRADSIHKERERVRVELEARAARVKSIKIDPFSGQRIDPNPWDDQDRGEKKAARAATEGQIGALERFGVKPRQGITFVEATKQLDYLVGRAQAGLATQKQIWKLTTLGVDKAEARDLTIGEASAEIDRRLRGDAAGVPA